MMNPALQELKKKINDRNILVGIIGLGYVGLPLSLTFLRRQIPVLGFDLDPGKIEMLAAGRSYIKHVGSGELAGFVSSGSFSATDDFARLAEPEVILICVPTPLTRNREPDLQYILATAGAIAATLRPGQLVVLESTTYPGTTDEVLRPVLEKTGLAAGIDFALAYSPEREDPGNPQYATADIPKVVGGWDDISTGIAAALYKTALKEVVEVATSQAAEMCKLLENIFRSVNIAMVNELKILCHRMGIDIWEVIRASSTKPFGFMPFYPGPGLGGHCIPIDPFYLTWKAKEIGRSTRFIELAGEINTEMPTYVVGRLALALNELSKAVRGSRVLILGLAYKADVDDTRESPSFALIEKLSDMGAKVDYSDPHIARTVPVRKHDLQMTSVELTPETIASYDAILLATAHTAVDYALLAEHAELIVDTRNAMGPFAEQMGSRLVRA
ncbi:MAG: nucleotide sugar dehydrogenase [Desulfobacterales bacterium]|nr:nucleotide sugar dehydrogenase [Desulfobacterales bacterium]